MNLYKTCISTPLGIMIACSHHDGLCLLEYGDRPELKNELDQLKQYFFSGIVESENDFLKQTKTELQEYFEGTRKEFEVPLVLSGTPFQMECWKMLQKIPYGETHTYQQQAEAMNKTLAIRAMAAANGSNKIAIIIPCHRVIGSNGKLTGYSGGLERKRWLLTLEMNNNYIKNKLLF